MQESNIRSELKQLLKSLLTLLDCDQESDQGQASKTKPEIQTSSLALLTADEVFEELCVAHDWDALLTHLRNTQMPLNHGHIMCLIEHAQDSYILGCAVEASCLDYDDLKVSLVPLAIVMPDWARDFFTPEFKTHLTTEDMCRVIWALWPNTQQLAWFARHDFLTYFDQKILLHKSIMQADAGALLPLLKEPFDITEGMLIRYLIDARKNSTVIYDLMVARLYQLSKKRLGMGTIGVDLSCNMNV